MDHVLDACVNNNNKKLGYLLYINKPIECYMTVQQNFIMKNVVNEM